jgi:hypothetical protein
MTVLLFSEDRRYVVVNLKKVEKRSTTEPVMTYTIRGPRDSLVESLDSNLSLIRYRIKSESLRIDMLQVGRRNHTQIAVIYFEDIANDQTVAEIKKRIDAIDVDRLSSSGELQAYLLNNKISLFPQIGIVERSDTACGALLEGKVIVLMDGSPWALVVAPKVFTEYLWSCDDFYMNRFIGTFQRILRIISLNLAFIVSSLYVAVVSYHSDALPSAYMIAIAQARANVPFSAILEVLIHRADRRDHPGIAGARAHQDRYGHRHRGRHHHRSGGCGGWRVQSAHTHRDIAVADIVVRARRLHHHGSVPRAQIPADTGYRHVRPLWLYAGHHIRARPAGIHQPVGCAVYGAARAF